MSRYYIQIETCRKGKARYFVGPFPSRQAAQDELDQAHHLPACQVYLADDWFRMAGRDLQVLDILTWAEARNAGLCDWRFNDHASTLLGPFLPLDVYEFLALSNPDGNAHQSNRAHESTR
jgi:hypothetical protein